MTPIFNLPLNLVSALCWHICLHMSRESDFGRQKLALGERPNTVGTIDALVSHVCIF